MKKIFSLLALSILLSPLSFSQSLKFGYEGSQKDSQHTGAKKFKELLEAKTDKKIKLSLFPDSSLGNAQSMISQVRSGTLDIEMSSSSNFTGLEPKLNVIDIPFIFKNREHAYKVLDGEIGEGLLKALDAQGFKALAWWDVGFRAFSNSKRPIKSPEDIKGLKVRTNQNPIYIQAFKILGANPVPMPLAELYTALETKAVDAQEHPLGIVWSAQLYQVQKYFSLTNHGYTPLLVVMNKEKFEALEPELQKALVEAAREAGAFQRKLNEDNEKEIIENMRKAGCEVIEDIDNQAFKAVVESEVRKSFIEANGDELVKKIDELAK